MRLTIFMASIAMIAIGTYAAAQNSFAPVISVNDRVITEFELDQRAKMLEVFGSPGNARVLAREQLIEDRLKQELLDASEQRLSPDVLAMELEAFAGRANLTTEQFVQILNQNGVDRSTFEEFVRVGINWRDYVRARFAREAQITDAEIDRELTRNRGANGAIEVLLSEIIIPAPPPEAATALAQAERISRIRSFAAFEAEARRRSALPSRTRGGRLDWLPIGNYPPALQSIILDLSPGEVTAPLPIPNGVALFQMRDVREVRQPRPVPSSVEYAVYYLGASDTIEDAREIEARVDTCDDLYGLAKGQPAERLERGAYAPSDVPGDIAMELAKLDPGEVSYSLMARDSRTRMFVMLCQRNFTEAENIDREAIRNQLRSRRLTSLAENLLADQRSAAQINE